MSGSAVVAGWPREAGSVGVWSGHRPVAVPVGRGISDRLWGRRISTGCAVTVLGRWRVPVGRVGVRVRSRWDGRSVARWWCLGATRRFGRGRRRDAMRPVEARLRRTGTVRVRLRACAEEVRLGRPRVVRVRLGRPRVVRVRLGRPRVVRVRFGSAARRTGPVRSADRRTGPAPAQLDASPVRRAASGTGPVRPSVAGTERRVSGRRTRAAWRTVRGPRPDRLAAQRCMAVDIRR